MTIPYTAKIHHAIFFIFFLFFLTGCNAKEEPLTQTGFYFDTIIQVTLYDEKKANCLDDCMELAEKYEKMLSPSLEGSDIWKINHSSGTPVTVSDETIYLLKTALAYCEMTDGQIDITIEPLNSLWDFHADPSSSAVPDNDGQDSRLPDKKAIAEALNHVDYHSVVIDGNTVTLQDPQSAVSLGFIAKGYIADKMKPDGSPYQFGIQKPFDKHGAVITVLPVNDLSAVSSGVYERYFYQDDVLYHHILNPQNGYPVQNELLGVTILSDSSMTGDALSTTCFVLGLDKGMALIESLDHVEAVFITTDYELHFTSGMKTP